MDVIDLIYSADFITLMTVMMCGFAIVTFLVWKVARYMKAHKDVFTKAAVVKTKGTVRKKFFGGAKDVRIDGTPHMIFEVTLNDKTFEVEQGVDQKLYFDYEEGDEIDLFVTTDTQMKIYPLDTIREPAPEPVATN